MFKKKKCIYHILLSSDREVKHTLLYPQMHLFYLRENSHGNGWVKKNMQYDSPVLSSAPQYLGERCFV